MTNSDNLSEDSFPENSKTAARRQERPRRIMRLVGSFALGQGAVQGIGIVIGLFLVRTLSVSDYAKFGLASGFQTTTSTLMDLGCASTIIPLVGHRILDRDVVGRYTRGVQSLRNRAFWIMSPFAAAAFLVVTLRQHWPWRIQGALLLTVLLALYSSGPASYYSAALVLHRKMRDFYLPQAASSLCRLAVYGIFDVTGALNAWTAAGLNALNVAVNASVMGKKSRRLMDWPGKDDPAIQREIRNYVFPASPAIIFGAFHGQIALFLISIFGQTVNIAQVAAIGRLGQLFAVMMTFNIVIVEPYVARLGRERLLRTYLRMIGIAALGGTALAWIAFAAPGLFLWILGPKYEGLRRLIGWVIATACINYVAGLIWIMNRSRKWIFWRGTIAEIALLIVVQAGFVIAFGIRSTRNAVMFNFASSFCYLIAHSYVAAHGFRSKSRSDDPENAVLSPAAVD